MFARLRERFSRLELLEIDLSHRPAFGLRSLSSLPVRFTAA